MRCGHRPAALLFEMLGDAMVADENQYASKLQATPHIKLVHTGFPPGGICAYLRALSRGPKETNSNVTLEDWLHKNSKYIE